MQKIDTLGKGAYQQTQIVLDDGTVATFTFRYLAAAQRWSFDVQHDDLILRGITLCLSPNILRAWRKTCRFGLACVSTDWIEPVSVEDFANGRVSVYVLDATETAEVETGIGEGTL
jgi:hypothetical protein